MKIQRKEMFPANIQEADIVNDIKTVIDCDKQLDEFKKALGNVANPQQMKRWLIDLCQAEDIKTSKDGEEHRTPNWAARYNGWKEVALTLGYTKREAIVTPAKQSKILIQVVGGQQVNINEKPSTESNEQKAQ